MIPYPTPPLTSLAVLVTRPLGQGEALCRRITALGGEAVHLPAVDIEPLTEPVRVSTDPLPGPHHYDVVIFVSPNAVAHGLAAIERSPDTVIAAIGKSTAAALSAAGATPAIVPATGFTSEALLAHDGLQAGRIERVLIVRGGAGREILGETLADRGIEVDYLEVYRRLPAAPDPAILREIEQRWQQGGIDIVTITSSEILHNLDQMLGDGAKALLRATPLLVVSERLATVAQELGCRGEILVAPAADDDTVVGVLANWRTRGRVLS